MSADDDTAAALASLLAVVAADREARCREILAPAEAQAAARLAEAQAAARRGLRRALVEERRRLHMDLVAARARRDAAQRARRQRLALAAADEGWALLEPALVRRWRAPETRRRWIAAALAEARRRLPPGGWRLRHGPGLTPEEVAALLRQLAAQGIADARCELDEGIAAGIEVRAGDACLDATVAGLLADRAAVVGRLLHWWQEG